MKKWSIREPIKQLTLLIIFLKCRIISFGSLDSRVSNEFHLRYGSYKDILEFYISQYHFKTIVRLFLDFLGTPACIFCIYSLPE
jgi:hypothetical protein